MMRRRQNSISYSISLLRRLTLMMMMTRTRRRRRKRGHMLRRGRWRRERILRKMIIKVPYISALRILLVPLLMGVCIVNTFKLNCYRGICSTFQLATSTRLYHILPPPHLLMMMLGILLLTI
ncbi:hypothetical protein FOZ62_012642, partial [Perkinsus olseni]